MTAMDSLHRLLGHEQDFDHLCHTLRHCVDRLNPAVVGALHVTCSDESERECIEAFQRAFVEPRLPSLKLWSKCAFRTSNLGGRYEWGAIRIAEQHFATEKSRHSFKTVVLKINSHVSVEKGRDGPRYGPMRRYGIESVACGALHALLAGESQPFTRDLHDAFIVDGRDILATLKNTATVNPTFRSLFAAIVCARVQARRAILDIQDYHPASPTFYVILPCVTLNRPERDTELPCGVYSADYRAADPTVEYCGLGDDPAKYQVEHHYDQLVVQDDQIQAPRPARDHRKHLLRQWQAKKEDGLPEQLHQDDRFQKFLAEAQQKKHHDHRYAKEMLKSFLLLAADLNPISAAVTLFATGIGGIYHAHRMHRIVHDVAAHDDARGVLTEIHDKVEGLSPEQTRDVIRVLLEYYTR